MLENSILIEELSYPDNLIKSLLCFFILPYVAYAEFSCFLTFCIGIPPLYLYTFMKEIIKAASQSLSLRVLPKTRLPG